MSRTISLVFVTVLLATAAAAQVPEIPQVSGPAPLLTAAWEEIGGGVTLNSECNEGAIGFFATGYCCESGFQELSKERCVDGQWVFIEYVCGTLCPFYPPPQ